MIEYLKKILILLFFCRLVFTQESLIKSEIAEYLKNLPIESPRITLPVFPPNIVNIKDFGAIGDGKFLNTIAIKSAIEHCVRLGGGTVLIPAGVWLTGPIKLESNINLKLERGAFIQFSKNIGDYPIIERLDDKSKKFIMASPIYAANAENIAITGEGIIDGAGEVWRYVKKEKQTEQQWRDLVYSGGVVSADGKQWWPSKEAMEAEQYIDELEKSGKKLTRKDVEKTKEYFRPDFVRLSRSERILIDGVTFLNSPRFHLHFVQSENIVVRNVKVYSPWWGQNTDGIDLSACRDVLVYKSTVDVGDDGICIKPSKIYDEQTPGPACERILITDNVVYHAHGGFVIGSEGVGGAKNIYVKDNTFIGTDVGIRFKCARDRGGLIENIFIEKITMRDIKEQAILFDMFYNSGNPETVLKNSNLLNKNEPITTLTPVYQNIFIKNITCLDANRSILINGLSELPIKNVVIENSYISSKIGASITNADSVRILNSEFKFKTGPAFTISQSKNLFFNGITFNPVNEKFFHIKGDKTKNIILENVNFSNPDKQILISDKANKNAIIHK